MLPLAALLVAAPPVSFIRDVAPTLRESCLGCHDSRKAAGKLDLSTFEKLRAGGTNGDPVTPGDPAGSDLYALMVTHEPRRMPPRDKGEAVPPAKAELVRRWIEQGAALDADVSPTADLTRELRKRWQPPRPPERYPFPSPVTALAFTPDGTRLVTGGVHELLVWDAAGKLLQRLPTRAERAHAVAVLADGRLAVAGGRPGQEGDVRLYTLDGADPEHLFDGDDSVLCLAVSADGKRLAAGGTDRLVRVWDVGVKPARQTHTIDSHADWVLGLAFSPDGKRLASAARDKTVKVWDFAANEGVASFTEHAGPVAGVAFTGDKLVSAGADVVLRQWGLDAGKGSRPVGGHGDEVTTLLTLPGGKLLATASADGTVRTWAVPKLAAGRVLPTFNDVVYSLATSPDGKRLAAGAHTGEVRVWAVADGAEVGRFVAAPK
jgi:WD40 repeat protein